MKVWERFLKIFRAAGSPRGQKTNAPWREVFLRNSDKRACSKFVHQDRKCLSSLCAFFCFPRVRRHPASAEGGGKEKGTRSRAMIQIPVCRKSELVCMKADRRKNGCQAVLQGVIARKDRKVLTWQSVLIHKTCSIRCCLPSLRGRGLPRRRPRDLLLAMTHEMQRAAITFYAAARCLSSIKETAVASLRFGVLQQPRTKKKDAEDGT